MDVLVTARQLALHGDEFRGAAPAARFLAMDTDGTIRDGDVVIAAEEARAAVAFGSTDLFDAGEEGASDDAIAHFFGWVLGNEDLDWFHIAAAGVDHPVFGHLLERGVRLTNSHHTDIPISEYVLAQVLRARVPLDTMAADRAERAWRSREWDEVASSRWLVIGMGAIGTAVATRARAFGAHVTGVRRTPAGDEPVDTMIGPDDVLDAVGDHDVIVLAVPATAATTGMVDADFLSRLAPETILVNVGRGALVDEDALRASLDAARPSLAVLDVAGDEPPPQDHWLWDHPDVVLTSHTSAGGRQRVARAAAIFADNLARYVQGVALVDEVRPADR